MRETDRAVAVVLAVGEELDPTGVPQAVERPGVVRRDLGLGGALLQTRLGAVLLELSAAEQGRGDAVEGGGLVQPDEGVGLQPVAAHAVPPVDQRHAGIGVVDERIGEGHPHGSRAHHEVVDVQRARHGSTVAPLRACRPRRGRAGFARPVPAYGAGVTSDVLLVGCGDLGAAVGLRLAGRGHEVLALRRDAARVPPRCAPCRST